MGERLTLAVRAEDWSLSKSGWRSRRVQRRPPTPGQPILPKRRTTVGHLAVGNETEPGDGAGRASGKRQRDNYFDKTKFAESAFKRQAGDFATMAPLLWQQQRAKSAPFSSRWKPAQPAKSPSTKTAHGP